MKRPFAVALAVCFFVTSLALFAQYQVNRQIYGSSGPANGSVRYAPQYLGYAANVPSSSVGLPSEARNAFVRSGALPSDVRTGYNAIGPMAAGGVMAYIPKTQIPRAASPGPPGNAVNPAVNSYVSSGPSSFAAGASMNGSVRYSGVPTSAAMPVSTMTNASMGNPITSYSVPIPGSALTNTAPMSQSIRYNQ